jgi:hypothetical protein
MEGLAVYLIKSGVLIALFYTAYFFLLRKETFFKSNRWYLLLGLVTSVLLPLVTYKKVIWIEPLPRDLEWATGPVLIAPSEPQSFEINWLLVISAIYVIGILAFILTFLLDFYSLNKALKGKTVYQQADFRFVDTKENVAPFSYFNYIVYNSSLYSDAELANIIEHEKVHSNQNHTMDVLFARAFCIVFWFNPFVWLYKKAMLQNLEFIADSEATKNIADKKSYQITLLKVTAHENCVDITNHFYQSLIKKRIVMLNKNQSKKWNSWKYFLIVPALAAFMFYFQVKVIAQEKETVKIIEEALQHNGAEVVVDKNTSDAELKQECKRVKQEHGVTLKFSKVKRNSSGEITAIKATFKDENGKKGTTQINGNDPIQPIRFFKNDSGAIGFGNGRQRDVRVIRLNGSSVVEAPEAPELPDFDFDFDFDFDDQNVIVVEAPEPPEPGEAIHAQEPPMPGVPGHKSIVIQKPGKDGKPMVIIDGKVIAGADMEKVMDEIGPIIIDGEDVLKKGGVYTYSSSGNGKAIVIDSKKITKDATEKANAAMKKAGPQMEKAREAMANARVAMDAQREQMRKDRNLERDQEMKAAREEIEQAREELRKEKAELEKAKADLEKHKATKN